MGTNRNNILTPHFNKSTIIENGVQYFVYGKNRIKITEHFATEGKSFGDMMVDVILHVSKNKSVA